MKTIGWYDMILARVRVVWPAVASGVIYRCWYSRRAIGLSIWDSGVVGHAPRRQAWRRGVARIIIWPVAFLDLFPLQYEWTLLKAADHKWLMTWPLVISPIMMLLSWLKTICILLLVAIFLYTFVAVYTISRTRLQNYMVASSLIRCLRVRWQ